jgi:hypothetical protein
MNHTPIVNLSHTALLIRDNKVIGECNVETMCDDRVSVRMIDNAAKALIAETELVKIIGDPYHVFIQFNSCEGFYLGTVYDHRFCSELNEIFKGVRIVDKHSFEYRMVPDSFIDVPGCGSGFKQLDGHEKVVNY